MRAAVNFRSVAAADRETTRARQNGDLESSRITKPPPGVLSQPTAGALRNLLMVSCVSAPPLGALSEDYFLRDHSPKDQYLGDESFLTVWMLIN